MNETFQKLLMIKEYLAQLHILNAIEVAVYRLQMNVFYDKRLHKNYNI